MDPSIIIGLILFGILAGILGTMFGLGGGIILVPVLTIIYGLSASEAAAVSLVGIIAASSGGASRSLRKRATNIKLTILLEIPTAVGAVIGAAIAVYIDDIWLLILFACVLIYSGIRMAMNRERIVTNDGSQGKYDFAYYDDKDGSYVKYSVQNVPTGGIGCGFAGALASMTGVGGGAMKVPLMNIHMGVPMKAATATSTLMVGITAFSGAIVYFIGGQIMLDYAAPIAVGAFFGSLIGFRISQYFDGRSIRKYFSVLLFIIAAAVLLNAGGIL